MVGRDERDGAAADRWIILRTTGAKTLPLARSLREAGFDVWTPERVMRRVRAHARLLPGGKRPTIDVDAPIMPTLVFARAVHLGELAIASVAAVSPHPSFSIFRHAGRVPLVGDAQIDGLRAEEREQAEIIAALRECETRDEERRARAAAMRTKAARLKALRSERRRFAAGDRVRVADYPAFAGMVGVIESSDGKSARVVFGGTWAITIEAWQILPVVIDQTPVAA
jgi:hypothetical protein